MEVISHRGFWLKPEEKNTLRAFQHTVRSGFGTELDVRDHLGKMVISHDPVLSGADPLPFEAAISTFAETKLNLAINIKSDGLVPYLKPLLERVSFPWFVFDMSGPEQKRYIDAGFPVFTRHSDIEPNPICYESSVGVWLDDFAGGWISAAAIAMHLSAGKKVCVVSPELHKREPEPFWRELKRSDVVESSNLLLCSDYPDKAKQFFEIP